MMIRYRSERTESLPFADNSKRLDGDLLFLVRNYVAQSLCVLAMGPDDTNHPIDLLFGHDHAKADAHVKHLIHLAAIDLAVLLKNTSNISAFETLPCF